MRNEFQPFLVKKPGPKLVDLLSQPIRGLVFDGKWLEVNKMVTTTLVIIVMGPAINDGTHLGGGGICQRGDITP